MTLTPDTGVRRAFLFALTIYSCGTFPRNLPRMFIHSLYGIPVNFISQPIPESLPHELQIAPPSPGVLRLSVQRNRSLPKQYGQGWCFLLKTSFGNPQIDCKASR